MTSTDLLYSDVDVELRAGLRAMLGARSAWPDVLRRTETAETADPALWHTLATEMELAGLAVPEEFGGAAAGFHQTAVVLEELGRAVAPVPYLSSAVIATAALLASRDAELLAVVASGEKQAALAVPFSSGPAAPPHTVHADGSVLTGTVRAVAGGLTADVLLVPTAGGLFAVSAAEAVREPVVSLDQTRPLADLSFSGAYGRLLARGDAAAEVVVTALVTGAALLASEQVGVAQWCLDTTVEYVRERHQFGRPIGSFQAVKHRLADVWVEVAQARAVARHAAVCAGAGGWEAVVAASLAQAYCGPVAVLAAETCVQLHGGVGFTWEHPAHLYLKRAKSSAIGLGTADRHRAALAAMVDLPPA
ncbi:alkylation response protein AidB-like acyl-CoA dehydrogenase [Allocatelliglobosispora scoriae]|uniref:Alkylation response protein AidB-like acyl-CoA dehydrogenase n=1 Tax=Allocatelliglobosispora scoriae TaxID=643052 RepID=A0A841BY89_9ACTN|nr:acyl-CoA dehydrogenase family protein [Allocatelliglobosispora scoriae]MBB5872635.1 alkylation response protein AidB-like acyl-CoA dehydrogenase [Allocatelliglobosispora scoriae]